MAETTLGAVIFVGQGGLTMQERLVQRAIESAAHHLVNTLAASEVQPVIVAGPHLDWAPDLPGVIRDEDVGPFLFGPRLADIVERYRLSPVMYFGGGSTPLLETTGIETMLAALRQAEARHRGSAPNYLVLTNNLHSSDWLGLTQAADALPVIRQAPRDNSLAWMLQHDGRYDVRVLAGSTPASGLDLDTPTDLALARAHALCPAPLREALVDPLLDKVPVGRVADVVARDGSHVALIGRVAPAGWQALSQASQCWIRVFSEERGMVASERLARGEVRTLLGRMVTLLKPEGFFAEIADVCDAAIIDSRVMMAAAGRYPPDADRFASDLFMTDAIADEWLRAFSAAAAAASIPVLLGGHSLVAAGLFVLADLVAVRRRPGR